MEDRGGREYSTQYGEQAASEIHDIGEGGSGPWDHAAWWDQFSDDVSFC